MMAKHIWRIAWVDVAGSFKTGPTNWPDNPTEELRRDTSDRWIGAIDISAKVVAIPAEAIAAMEEV
jgi:hypothetical protein